MTEGMPYIFRQLLECDNEIKKLQKNHESANVCPTFKVDKDMAS